MRTRLIIAILLITAVAMAAPPRSAAGVDIHIAIPLPGVFVYPAPAIIPAPGYYGYAAPVPPPLFYGGYWYRPSGGQWFISAQVGGPWYVISAGNVPAPVLRVPHRHAGGRGHEGRYVAPRYWYEDGGHHGRHED